MNNPMKEAPVNSLMLKMGTPIILSMMMQALYNIVDSAFVSNMGTNGEMALNALTLAFPVQVLLIALGIGTGVGMNVVVARSLGKQDYDKASRTAGTTKVLAFIIFVMFFLFGIFGVKFYIGTQTTNATISEMAVVYLRICCMFSLGNVYFTVYEKLLQAHGRSKYSTIAQIAGALTNIVLDPILIYGLLGLPRMEVVGAALATVIGQFVSMGLGWYFHRKYDNEILNDRKYLKISVSMVKEIYSIGFPAIVAQALNAGPQSLVISLLRQFVLVIPVAYVFSNMVIVGNASKSIIWFTFLIAEVLTALVGYIMLKKIIQNSLSIKVI